MGWWRRFLDLLFGRTREPVPEPPGAQPAATLPRTPPPDAQRVGDSLMMAFTHEGQVVLMDLDAFDYHFSEQHHRLPDPAQRDLDEVLPRVNRVRVRAGGMLRGTALAWPVLIDTSEDAAVAALRPCLAIREDPSAFMHCSCLGGPTLELFADSELVATLSVHHGKSLRWGRWRHDAPLQSNQIDQWLVQRGLDRALLDLLYQNPFAMARSPQAGSTEPLAPLEQKLFLAQILANRQALAEAAAVCNEVIEADPGSRAGWAARGSIRKAMGELEGALADLSNALEHGGPDAELSFERGVLLDQLGRREEAEAELTHALAVQPDHVNALNSRGIVRMQLRQLDAAKADLDEAVRLAPDWELPYVNRAQVERMRGDMEAARRDYTVAIEKLTVLDSREQRPLLAALLWNRSLLLAAIGEVAQAEADRQRALALDPRLAGAGPRPM